MAGTHFQLTMAVLNTACVLIVIAFFLIRSERAHAAARQAQSLRDIVILSLVFGGFSLYAGLNAIKAFDAVVSLRHTGPIVGGFIGGPWVGFIAGTIGAVDRYWRGGPSMPSAVVAVILAGTLAGLYSRYIRTGQPVRVWEAMAFTVAYEVFAASLTFLVVPDVHEALRIESGIRVPLVIGNGVGVALFIACIRILAREREIREAKKQMESELGIARRIQSSMVPKLFPTFPAVREFELHALIRPAKEVGGDLYNFIRVDAERFCFMVGDVSGKGVPAALYMAVAQTVLASETRATLGQDCARILARANEELYRDNEESMFVTVLFGALTVPTGAVEICSAGHSAPFLIRQDGTISRPPCRPGLSLGAMDGVTYTSHRIHLTRGDMLVLYTDGVSEAFSPNGQLFGDAGLEATLHRLAGTGRIPTPAELTQEIVAAVDRFAAGEPQSDDITLLVLQYQGAEVPASD